MTSDKSRKGRLSGLLRQGGEPRPPEQVPTPEPAPPASSPPAAPVFPLSTLAAPDAVALPAAARELSPELQHVARQYITARRRTGEALLEACRWMAEARRLAEHGEWLLFLEVTGSSPDHAERQLHIFARAEEHPHFARAILDGWLNQSAAALLARPSTPETVIGEVLAAPKPPRFKDIERAIKVARTGGAAQIPHIAAFAEGQFIEGLSPAERELIPQLVRWLEQHLADPRAISTEDWALLAPLARALSELLAQRES